MVSPGYGGFGKIQRRYFASGPSVGKLEIAMIKAIFFDAAGTLIYLPCPVGEHYAEVIAGFGCQLDPAGIDRAFRRACAAMPPRPASDGPRADDDKGWWRELVTRVFIETLPPEQAVDFDAAGCFEALYAHFALPGVWAAFPDVVETLETLRDRGFLLGVISNFDRRLHAVFGHLDLTRFFRRILVSSEVGADKPDPLIFQRALAGFGVAAAEAMHVGDDPTRDGGAEAVGVRVFRLERPKHSLRDLLKEECLQAART